MQNWTEVQIKLHKKAGQKLGLIKDEVKEFIWKNGTKIYETDVIKFVKNTYKKHDLVNDDRKEFCIVAFGKSTNHVHYFPSSTSNSGLKTKNLILLDIWARLNKKNAPYADATFMFYFGTKIPKEIQKVWKVLVKSRSKAVQYIENEIRNGIMPRALDIDRVAHDVIENAGFGNGIKHTIGHSLGLTHPHGKLPGINWREYAPLIKNVGYTVEPGIYLERFGMRSEIDFYISSKNETIITTPLQKEIELI